MTSSLSTRESARPISCLIPARADGGRSEGVVWLVPRRSAPHSYVSCGLGTRWLSKWDKEIGLFVKLLYYGLTIGRGV